VTRRSVKRTAAVVALAVAALACTTLSARADTGTGGVPIVIEVL
jgi:hypothetical protein